MWESLQERLARSRVLMLYRIRNYLVATPATEYLHPVPTCTRGFETKYIQIQCNTNIYSQSFFPHTISLSGTLWPSMFAGCHLTALRPVWAASSSSSRLRSCFYFLCFTTQTLNVSCSSSIHSTAFTARNCFLLAVRYYSVLSRHLYWKMRWLKRKAKWHRPNNARSRRSRVL